MSLFFGANYTETVPPLGTTPTSFSNLELWLDGDDPNNTGVKPADNSAATGWSDKSGNGWDYGVSRNSPTYHQNVLNSRGGFYLDDDGFDESLMPNILTSFTLISIYQIPTSVSGLMAIFSNGRCFTSNGDSAGCSYLLGYSGSAEDTRGYRNSDTWQKNYVIHDYTPVTYPLTVDHVHVFDTITTSSKLYTDNILRETEASDVGATGDQTSYDHTIGYNPFSNGQPLIGYVCELIFYSKALSDIERTDLYDNYLQPKYNL